MNKKSGIGKKILLSICIIIVILAIILIILIKNNKLKIITEPVIYYMHEDGIKIPLLVNNKTFSNNTKITWPKTCTGVIKKDGIELSKENGMTITQEGNYEITITSIVSRKSTTKTLYIDRTPPNIEIKQNPSGSYTITFEDVSDIGVAKLERYDLETMQIVSETDFITKESGLQKSIEITEKGYYNIRIEDYYGNVVSKDTTFSIK